LARLRKAQIGKTPQGEKKQLVRYNGGGQGDLGDRCEKRNLLERRRKEEGWIPLTKKKRRRRDGEVGNLGGKNSKETSALVGDTAVIGEQGGF